MEKTYPSWYKPNHALSYEDQKSIQDSLPLPQQDEQSLKEFKTNNVIVNGSVNSGHKLQENTKETFTKQEVIAKLKECNYRTAPKKIAFYLDILFANNDTKEGHWLYIAQHYNPKTINSVIDEILKQHRLGQTSIQKPAAYFTKVIKFHRVKKKFRSINGGYKLTNKGESNV